MQVESGFACLDLLTRMGEMARLATSRKGEHDYDRQ
jgi:hypothetical protein